MRAAIVRDRHALGLPVPRGPRASSRTNSWGLTAREVEILGLLTEGLSNKDIGLRLYLSHRTVASHLYRMFPKLGVTSRAQLARAASGR